MSVFAAATPFELDEGSLQASSRAGFPGPFGAGGELEPFGPACACGAYALAGPHVITLVLDDSHEGLVEGGQREWLEERLQEAGQRRKPVIVVGNADLGQQLAPGQSNQDAELLFAALTGQDPDGKDPGPGGGRAPYVASAYFYDSVEQNIAKRLTFRGRTLSVFGSGTLGYESPQKEQQQEFHGAKGILLGEVVWGGATGLSPAQQHEYEAVNEAFVRARLVPVVGELALEAQDGLVIPRSHPALFAGLARKPHSGCRLGNETTVCSASEGAAEGRYIPIPSICVGQSCGEAVLPEYEFTSSRPDIGGFVEVNTASNDPRSVLQNASHEPVKAGVENSAHEQVGSRSALFCAYNKGETVIGIHAGGLSYSLTVQVQAGSVRQPCGTVPVREKPETATNPVPAPPPPTNPAPAPAASPPPTAPPPVPAPPVLAPTAAVPAAVTPFIPLAAIPAPLLPFVPPPLPTPARPTPPSGTSAVTSPVQAVEKEEEEEEATESVSNQATAYHESEHEPATPYILGIVLLAAFAGASVGRGVRGRRRGVQIAPATVNSSRQQRRLSRDQSERRW